MALRCSCPPVVICKYNLRKIACVFGLTCAAVSFAQQQSGLPKQSPYLTKGRLFYTELKKTLNTEKLKPGDPVEFSLLEATLVSGHVVVPANARLHGKVVQTRPADKIAHRESILAVIVESITWKQNSVPVCATIAGFGTREFRFSGDSWPTSTQASELFAQSSAVLSGRPAMGDLHVGRGAIAAQMETAGPAGLGSQETNVVRNGDQFVRDLSISRSSNSASVLARRDKSIKLAGGILVALEELPHGEEACPATVSQ